MSPSGPVESTLTLSVGSADGEYGGVARLRRLQDPSERAALRGVFPQVRGVVLVLQGHELDLLR